MPWYVGIAIVLAAVGYTACQMFYVGCPAPTGVEFIVLAIIPLVYLGLMYLTWQLEDLPGLQLEGQPKPDGMICQ